MAFVRLYQQDEGHTAVMPKRRHEKGVLSVWIIGLSVMNERFPWENSPEVHRFVKGLLNCCLGVVCRTVLNNREENKGAGRVDAAAKCFSVETREYNMDMRG